MGVAGASGSVAPPLADRQCVGVSWGPPPPGWGNPPPGWGTPGGYLPPLPPEQRLRNGPAIAIAVVCVLTTVAILATLITIVVMTVDWDGDDLTAGDCVEVSLPDFSNVEPLLLADELPCAEPAADYVVAATRGDPNGSCPPGDYRRFIHESWDYAAQLLCLIPNVATGECFSSAPDDPGRFPCGLGERRDGIEVIRVVGAGDAACGGGVSALRFTVPPHTICYQDFAPGG
jgi:hypothetical protein